MLVDFPREFAQTLECFFDPLCQFMFELNLDDEAIFTLEVDVHPASVLGELEVQFP